MRKNNGNHDIYRNNKIKFTTEQLKILKEETTEDIMNMTTDELNELFQFKHPVTFARKGGKKNKTIRRIKRTKSKNFLQKTKKTKYNTKQGDLTTERKIKVILNKLNKLKEYNIHKNMRLYLPPSNQYNSGRCWIFSFLNGLRLSMIHKYKLPPTFSFSSSYLLFWDKYEKSKYFFYRVCKYSHLPMDNIENHLLFRSIVNDGGTWNMLQNLITTYGIIPYESMKESKHSLNTQHLNNVLCQYLKTASKSVRDAPPSKQDNVVRNHMKKIYDLLTKCIGKPPKTILFKKVSSKPIKPLKFYEDYVRTIRGNDVMKKIVLIHVPNLEENKYYVIDELNNKKDGYKMYYYNVSLRIFKSSILTQLNDNIPVWFGCDFNKFNHRGESLLNDDINMIDMLGLKKRELFLKKKHSIAMYETNMNHAMLLTGYFYQTTKNKPHYWIVENSHGEKMKNISYEQNHGFLTMSDSWFGSYVIMAVINEQYFQGHLKSKNNCDVISMPKWSNLGELLLK